MTRILLLLALLLPGAALAQGYAGLGSDATGGFAEVRPETRLAFPADHGPHPAFRIEWWYVTATLEGEDGARYGVQWTLFRSALAPPTEAAPAPAGWQSRQLWMAHAAVTTAEVHHAAERYARGGVGQAGVELAPFRAWIDEWRFESAGEGAEAPFSPLGLSAAAPDFAYDLSLTATGPLVLQGDEGYSVKSEAGQASHYYSQPFFEAEGTITVGGREVAVRGTAWMDREWSTQPLTGDQSGWDWFSIRFDDGPLLMLYRLRHEDGDDYVTGNWITRDGGSERLAPGEIGMTPLGWSDVAGREVPTRWRIEIPARGVEIESAPLNAQSWNDLGFPYWEGPVTLSGSHEGTGYLEMTGY